MPGDPHHAAALLARVRADLAALETILDAQQTQPAEAPAPTPDDILAGSTDTKTPGLWFNGSPLNDLAYLASKFETYGRIQDNMAIYFTRDPIKAQVFSGERGRVYSVELLTRNPIWLDSFNQVAHLSPGSAMEFINMGHDAVVCERAREIAVLDLNCIKYIETGMGRTYHTRGSKVRTEYQGPADD